MRQFPPHLVPYINKLPSTRDKANTREEVEKVVNHTVSQLFNLVHPSQWPFLTSQMDVTMNAILSQSIDLLEQYQQQQPQPPPSTRQYGGGGSSNSSSSMSNNLNTEDNRYQDNPSPLPSYPYSNNNNNNNNNSNNNRNHNNNDDVTNRNNNHRQLQHQQQQQANNNSNEYYSDNHHHRSNTTTSMSHRSAKTWQKRVSSPYDSSSLSFLTGRRSPSLLPMWNDNTSGASSDSESSTSSNEDPSVLRMSTSYSLKQLKDMCKQRNLSQSGTKLQIAKRIIIFDQNHKQQPISSDGSSSDSDPSKRHQNQRDNNDNSGGNSSSGSSTSNSSHSTSKNVNHGY